MSRQANSESSRKKIRAERFDTLKAPTDMMFSTCLIRCLHPAPIIRGPSASADGLMIYYVTNYTKLVLTATSLAQGSVLPRFPLLSTHRM